MPKDFNFWREHWNRRAAKNQSDAATGNITITWAGSRLQVSAPLNPAFVDGARELLGRWRPTSKMWTFDVRSSRLLIELCTRVYGKEAIVLVNFPSE